MKNFSLRFTGKIQPHALPIYNVAARLDLSLNRFVSQVTSPISRVYNEFIRQHRVLNSFYKIGRF